MAGTALKREVEDVLDRLPESATLHDLLLALQAASSEGCEIETLERDPESELRQSLRRGLAELDAGQGISDEALTQSLDPRR